MKHTALASPNWNNRPAGTVPWCIVLHADASASAKASISWIQSAESKVSYHALVDRDGTVYTFVDPSRRAWHAGKSAYKGVNDCNNFSLGLSFANRCDGVEPYTDSQVEAGAELVREWMQLYTSLSVEDITTHEAVAIPAGRKHDPGPLFPLDPFRSLCYDVPRDT